jgi:hypothetical protein
METGIFGAHPEEKTAIKEEWEPGSRRVREDRADPLRRSHCNEKRE